MGTTLRGSDDRTIIPASHQWLLYTLGLLKGKVSKQDAS
jgi:hypothetical protein